MLKRGRRTIFANILAKEKAVDGAGSAAYDWELLDYLDAGPNWQNNSSLYCMCGRKLRYQYVVQNRKTNDIVRFGRDHFREHTGIPPRLANQIIKGITEIDYELDEILLKINDGWTLADEGIGQIPASLPNDIQAHLDYEIPLLGRQISRLKKLIQVKMEQEQQRRKEALEREKQNRLSQTKNRSIQEYNSLSPIKRSSPLDEELEIGVIHFIYTWPESDFAAEDVCEFLVQEYDAPADRFSTGKYRIFGHVCIFLESLVKAKKIEFIRKDNLTMERFYHIL